VSILLIKTTSLKNVSEQVESDSHLHIKVFSLISLIIILLRLHKGHFIEAFQVL